MRSLRPAGRRWQFHLYPPDAFCIQQILFIQRGQLVCTIERDTQAAGFSHSPPGVDQFPFHSSGRPSALKQPVRRGVQPSDHCGRPGAPD